MIAAATRGSEVTPIPARGEGKRRYSTVHLLIPLEPETSHDNPLTGKKEEKKKHVFKSMFACKTLQKKSTPCLLFKPHLVHPVGET